MKISKKLLWKPCIVVFNDHALMADVVPCRAIGWLAEIKKDHLIFCYWDLPNATDELRQNNNEFFTIVRKAILEIKAL